MRSMVLVTLAALSPVGTLTSQSATSPTLPVGGLTCELCVDNDPTKAVRSICFDPFRSFFLDSEFGNSTSAAGSRVTAEVASGAFSYRQYVDLMRSQTVAQNSQNPAFGGVWSTFCFVDREWHLQAVLDGLRPAPAQAPP
ncbi:unnamed protein product [Polarella glacialis]|uniref:Uncharacterized protein n=1 Tax=Polarella glacialis TaxID=89957 RepID=A0A813GHX7_POLGL|nr:unnamed protein product [Polarella glacialis]